MNASPKADLMAAARGAAKRAYAPYSGYAVGAALHGEDGHVYTGCNVENASYGLTNCAERTALFSGVAAGCRRYTAVAVVTPGPRPGSPCGACRQVLSEFCAADTPVYLAGADDPETWEETTVGELLPRAFTFRPL